jgi:hypothetical protein
MLYTEFHEDSRKIIEKALDFVQEKIYEYYNKQLPKTSQVHHELIEKKRNEMINLVVKTRNFIRNTASSAYEMDVKDHQNLMNLIKSALEIYSDDLQQQTKLTDENIFLEEINEVRRILDLENIKKGKGDLFHKYHKRTIQQEGKKLEIFLTHSHKDIELASRLKKLLEKNGIDVFMAHKDIKPSKEWRDEILAHLESCDVLVALNTENFSKSPYSNQEVGIFMGKGKSKMIIPISFSKEISGFLESKQAIKAKDMDLEIIAEKIISAIKDRF